MGLTGFAIAIQRAEEIFGLPAGIGLALAWFAAGEFVLLAAAYATKSMRFPQGEICVEELGRLYVP